jgi:hypothetical protein
VIMKKIWAYLLGYIILVVEGTHPELPYLKMLIYYQVVGRKGIQWKMAEISLPLTKKQVKGG